MVALIRQEIRDHRSDLDVSTMKRNHLEKKLKEVKAMNSCMACFGVGLQLEMSPWVHLAPLTTNGGSSCRVSHSSRSNPIIIGKD